MPFNLIVFKQRAISAIVFAIIVLAGLLWNQWSFIILFTIIHFGCWYEFIKLLKKMNSLKYGYYLPTGLIYITLPIVLLIYLRCLFFTSATDNYSKIIPCTIVFSIWINDTMAYITGSMIGKTPFSKISPNKTWEGTIGGIILCIISIALLAWLFNYNVMPLTIVAAICAIAGTFGDLLESKLKRMANVKNSGTLMPGHGGFLDRFDSLLLAVPFVWLFVYFFTQ